MNIDLTQDRWPATKAGAPTPKVEGVPPELAKNLANFDDLDFRVYEDLKHMWTFAPDNRIKEHPVRFGTEDGEWTAVTGWLEGTFTKPMVLGPARPIASRWRRLGTGIMFEEFLFWDNGEFMKQIGLAQ